MGWIGAICFGRPLRPAKFVGDYWGLYEASWAPVGFGLEDSSFEEASLDPMAERLRLHLHSVVRFFWAAN